MQQYVVYKYSAWLTVITVLHERSVHEDQLEKQMKRMN